MSAPASDAVVPNPEALPSTTGLPVSGNFPDRPQRRSGLFSRSFWDWAGDVTGAACIFFLLFAGLFAGSLLQ